MACVSVLGSFWRFSCHFTTWSFSIKSSRLFHFDLQVIWLSCELKRDDNKIHNTFLLTWILIYFESKRRQAERSKITICDKQTLSWVVVDLVLMIFNFSKITFLYFWIILKLWRIALWYHKKKVSIRQYYISFSPNCCF